MYTMTPEEDFLIGPHPVNPSVLVAAGFSGHGFKFSTLVGRILAEVAVDGQTAYPVSRFRLDRFGG
jgi:glycine/D-amino acid oxidase-like deaminating enzyme